MNTERFFKIAFFAGVFLLMFLAGLLFFVMSVNAEVPRNNIQWHWTGETQEDSSGVDLFSGSGLATTTLTYNENNFIGYKNDGSDYSNETNGICEKGSFSNYTFNAWIYTYGDYLGNYDIWGLHGGADHTDYGDTPEVISPRMGRYENKFSLRGGNDYLFEPPFDFVEHRETNGAWDMITIAWDNSNKTIHTYIDGQEITTTSSSEYMLDPLCGDNLTTPNLETIIHGSGEYWVTNIVLYNSYYDSSTVQDLYNNEPIIEADLAQPVTIDFPTSTSTVVWDTPVTVEGSCPVNGDNRLAVFDGYYSDTLEYDVDCTDGTYSTTQILHEPNENITVQDKNSTCTDVTCYSIYDEAVTLNPYSAVDDTTAFYDEQFSEYQTWYVGVTQPDWSGQDESVVIETSTTTPIFKFHMINGNDGYFSEMSSSTDFVINRYDNDGNFIDEYHRVQMNTITPDNYPDVQFTDTGIPYDYPVELIASTTDIIHYNYQVVDTSIGDTLYNYSFGLQYTEQPGYTIQEPQTIFPITMSTLKEKMGFAWFFHFYDRMKKLLSKDFNTATSSDMIVNADVQTGDSTTTLPLMDTSIKPVQDFMNGVRPFMVTFLWLAFGIYLLYRLTHLFSDNI